MDICPILKYPYNAPRKQKKYNIMLKMWYCRKKSKKIQIVLFKLYSNVSVMSGI